MKQEETLRGRICEVVKKHYHCWCIHRPPYCSLVEELLERVENYYGSR